MTPSTDPTVLEKHSGVLRLEDLGEGVLLITFDTGQKGPPFVLSPTSLTLFDEVLERISGKHGVRGLLLRSAHRSVFCAGADVDAMADIGDRSSAEKAIVQGQSVFERLTRLPFPTVALIHGTCVGGGFEMALACTARTATPDAATRIGLPEVKLGIIPAWGGCTRLPRLAGLIPAVELITGAKVVNASKAMKLGLIDSLVPLEHLVLEGKALIDRAAKNQLDRKPPRTRLQWFLEKTPPGRKLLRRKAIALIHRETKGHYPAPVAALDTLLSGTTLDIPGGLLLEKQRALELLETPAHKNLLRLFRITRESRRPEIYRTGREAPEVKEIAVIGAGTMGAGIAVLLLQKGFGVRLIDAAPAALSKAWKLAREELEKRVRRRDLKPHEAKSILAGMTVSTSMDGLRSADLVIEAVPEKRKLKEDLLERLDGLVRKDAFLASNTSSFPIGELASGLSNPSRFFGLHFFNPPLRMPLLEIIRGPETSKTCISLGLAVAARIGKTPIVVGDGPGFLVNRLLAPYFMEAARLAQESVPITTIDGALVQFGMPMGPFRLMDEVGLDIVLDASQHMAAREGYDFAVHPFIQGLVDQEKLGKKNGEGFYRYDKRGKSRGVGSTFTRMFRDFKRPGADPGHEGRAIADRLIGRMVAEARKTLGENLVLSEEDVDIGTVFGIGFPAFRGGLLHHAVSHAEKRS